MITFDILSMITLTAAAAWAPSGIRFFRSNGTTAVGRPIGRAILSWVIVLMFRSVGTFAFAHVPAYQGIILWALAATMGYSIFEAGVFLGRTDPKVIAKSVKQRRSKGRR